MGDLTGSFNKVLLTPLVDRTLLSINSQNLFDRNPNEFGYFLLDDVTFVTTTGAITPPPSPPAPGPSTTVPEPQSVALLATGIGALLAMRRVRDRKTRRAKTQVLLFPHHA